TIAAVLFVITAATVLLTRNRFTVTPPNAPRSLAVAPFRDLSGSPDAQVLSDGISEMISARIAQAKGLRVISSFDGSAPKNDPLDFARRRGASLLLTGAVQHSGESVRVTYQLVDAQNGTRVGGDMATGRTNDIFTLEDLVADSVLQNLNVSRTHALRSGTELSGNDQQTYAEA